MPSTTTPDGVSRLRDVADLVAAVPHLIGFHPTDSLVLICLAERDDSVRVGLALRVDLPAEQDRQAVAAQLLAPVLGHRATEVIAVVLCPAEPRPWPAELPHAGLIAELDEAFGSAGVPIRHAVWAESIVDGAAWRCYDEADCCGLLPDPADNPIAAATALAGNVTFASRAEMRAVLDPDPPDALERRTALIDALLDNSGGVTPPGFDGPAEALRLLHATITAAAEQPLRLSDEDVARLAMALADRRVRDACLATVLGDLADEAERVWLALTRAVPGPERAEPAVLLAYASYLRGDGSLAGMALEVVEAADGSHRLGRLLRTALDHGMPPDELAILALDGAAEHSELMGSA
ncbi:DUF4192 domain-containing protein [Allokutzneria sp. A3M-2-11 16]|uniref:DUF4192 domain-containing protein n=1 Tax=Allokutzneria sp. A3M-2-11 16 TaxID=2962043 RepID=UPI0020B7E61F|nr:DUF4192 domain-containing protein [Allokutzneria sp. A3M-2-11 16]MCP3801652.1 DUF4192 domain-containing protein [Allokutzneria sp. A3M-2-11 16]